jgi:GH24 family phage-related lysozyme (muramidase)
MAAKKKKAGAAAAATGAAGSGAGPAAAAGGAAKPAKPCGTCDPTLPYSLAFKVKDGNGKLIEGMYYTVKYKNSGDVYEGTTQQHGRMGTSGETKRYYTSDASEEIYLYIGHRTKVDGLPQSRSGTENTYDEAPLHHDTVAPTANQKLSDAETQRLWKPWSISQNGRDAITREEQGIPYIYNDAAPFDRNGNKLRWNAPGGNPVSTTNSRGYTFNGNSTIGYGHLLHHGPVNPSNPLDAPYVSRNDLTQAEMDQLFETDLVDRGAAGTGKGSINMLVFVPLYQREYDALVNQTFNGARNRPAIIRKLIHGKYTEAGNLFQSNAAAPTQRRQQQTDMFFRGVY